MWWPGIIGRDSWEWVFPFVGMKQATLDHILTIYLAIENCSDVNDPLFMAFVDLKKAFNSINREALYAMLK